MPRIVITKGPGQGRDHAIGTECVVGRATDADFTIEDVGVSRRHARFYREGEVYVVTDLGSRNGTYVNTQRVQAASLNDGDVIRVGGVEMVFRQKDIVAGDKPHAVAVVVPPAVAVPPRAVPVPAAPAAARPTSPTRPAVPVPAKAPDKPAEAPDKKPMPKVVPTRRRGVF
jgi:predicted component of type VI protein secretion system